MPLAVISTTVLFGVLIPLAVISFMVEIWFQGRKKRRGKRDVQICGALNEGLQAFASQSATSTIPVVQGGRVYTGLRIGELSRHFDSDTTANIDGWLTHQFGFHGWGLGGKMRGVGLGVGGLGATGTSQFHASVTGTTRDNLLSDGFVAVFEFESAGGIDTIRVLVPSEDATREIIDAALQGLSSRFVWANDDGTLDPKYPLSLAAFQKWLPTLQRFETKVSYVSDRLTALLRLAADSRPDIVVYGYPMDEHTIVASAIRLGEGPQTYPLFPTALLTTLPQVVERALASA